MRKILLVVSVLCLLAGCKALASGTVSLSDKEKTQAQSLAERRQQIGFDRAAAQAEFQGRMNRLAEQENGLNIEAAKLCFEFKKAHKLPPNTNYQLDEWNGQLVKQ